MSRFARTTPSNPLGKLDAEIKGFRVASTTRDIIEREATALGIDLTHFVRCLLEERAHGADMLGKLHRDRYVAVAGKSQESAEPEQPPLRRVG